MDTAAPGTPSQRYSTLLTRFLGGGDWERALETARGWLAEDPESPPAHLGAGQALVNLKRYAQAQPHLAKALAGNPRHGFAHRLASIVHFHGSRFEKADEHIQQALALQPNEGMHWFHLAWMRHQQGALEVAAKHATRALELRPNDADIINLLALCERRDAKAQLAQYRRALALDPENSLVHNNLGAHYLGVDKDYEAAEQSFRRALTLNPSEKTFQRNLFLALRHRDFFYHVLTLPRTMLASLSWRRTKGSVVAKVLLLLLWLTLGRFLLGLLVFWFALVYPLLKAYEFLTLGDIQAQAGIPGARRGGFLGYRRWPFAVRFGIFAALTLLFWGTVVAAVWSRMFSPDLIGCMVVIAALIYIGWILTRWSQRFQCGYIVRRGEKKLHRQMNASGGGSRPPKTGLSS